jgi:hypothetical protein
MKKIFAVVGLWVALAAGAHAQSLPVVDPVGTVTKVQQAGDVRSAAQFAADCAAGVGLSNCVTPSTPKDCPAGKHWSTMGGVAHCVDVDPPCAPPNTLEHDALGNPNCKAPVITTTTETRSLSCPSGEEGSGIEQERTVTYTNGVPSYGGWATVSSACTPIPSTPTPTEPTTPTTPPTTPTTPTTPTCPDGSTWNGAECAIPVVPPQPPAQVCTTYTQDSYQCSGWFQYTRSMCTQGGAVVSDTLLYKEKIGSCSCSSGMVKYPCHSF